MMKDLFTFCAFCSRALSANVAAQNQEIANRVAQFNQDEVLLAQKLDELALKREVLSAFQSEHKDLVATVCCCLFIVSSVDHDFWLLILQIEATRTELIVTGKQQTENAGTISDGKAKLAALNQQIATLRVEADQLEAQKIMSEKKVADMKRNVTGAAGSLTSNSEHSGALDDERAALAEALQTAAETAFVLKANNDETAAELKALAEIIGALQEEGQKFTGELGTVQDRADHATSEILALTEQLADKEAEVEALRAQASELADAKLAADEAISALRSQVDGAAEGIHGDTSRLDQLLDEKNALEHQLRTASETAFVVGTNNHEIRAEIQALQEIIASLGTEVQEYSPEINSLQGKIDEVAAQVAANRLELADKEKEVESLRGDESDLLLEKADLLERIEDGKQKVRDVAQIAIEQTSKIDTATDEKSKVHHQLTTAEATCIVLGASNTELLSEIDHLKSILRSLYDEKKAVEEETGRLFSRHDGNASAATLKAQLTAKEAEQRALEDAAKELMREKQRLDASIIDMRAKVALAAKETNTAAGSLNSADDVKSSIEHQLNHLHEKAFEVSHSNKELESEIASGYSVLNALKDELKAIQDELGRIALEQSSSSDLVTNGQARVTEKEAELASLLAAEETLKNDKDLLDASIADMRQMVESVSQEALHASAALNSVGDLTASIDHKLNDLHEQSFLISQANTELESELNSKQDILDALKHELKSIQDELGRIGGEHGNANQVLLQKQREFAAKEQAHAELQRQQTNMTAAISKAEDDIAAARDQIAALTEQIVNCSARAESLALENEELAAKRKSIDIGAADDQSRVAMLSKQLKDRRAYLTELLERCNALSAELKALQEAARSREQARLAARNAAKEKGDEVKAKQALAAAIELERAEVEKKIAAGEEALQQMGVSKQMLEDGLLGLELDRLRNLCATARETNDIAIQARLMNNEAVALDNRRRNLGGSPPGKRFGGESSVPASPRTLLGLSPSIRSTPSGTPIQSRLSMSRKSTPADALFSSGQVQLSVSVPAVDESFVESAPPSASEQVYVVCDDVVIEPLLVEGSGEPECKESDVGEQEAKQEEQIQQLEEVVTTPEPEVNDSEMVEDLGKEVIAEPILETENEAVTVMVAEQPPTPSSRRSGDEDIRAKAERLVAERTRRSGSSFGADFRTGGRTPTRTLSGHLQHVDVYPVAAGVSTSGSSSPIAAGFTPSPNNLKRRQSSRRSEAGGFDLITHLLGGTEDRM
jgi:chromosome segregation ATPase